MCGIVVSLTSSTTTSTAAHQFVDLCTLNGLRGPDSHQTVDISLDNPTIRLGAFASVLHLRGAHVVVQPHRNELGDFLCWNGEIFEGLPLEPEENDGQKLFRRLGEATSVVDVLAHVEGPYAFVYYRAASKTLYFGRDPLGRRSLLVHRSAQVATGFILASSSTSASSGYDFTEVDCEPIHYIDLNLPTLKLESISRTSSVKTAPSHFVIIPLLNRVLPTDDQITRSLSDPSPELIAAVEGFTDMVDESVRLRVEHIPYLNAPYPGCARVAVLFSGGIDCTALAYLAHKHIPSEEPIDLLNVAFENPRSLKAKATTQPTTGDHMYDVPDRLTGREQVEELRKVCPGRIWNFVEVNVPYEECQRERPKVEALMYPNNTVMDLSLALALYFASRGIGVVKSDPSSDPIPYSSPARVLLSGLGSDELLGGYSRHRNAFSSSGWQGLIDELQLDLTRLPSRNLGRDDRVISANAKETRYPFLSLSMVAFLAQLPVHLKVNPSLGEGRGDKMLLRLATEQVGLVLASRRKKRAMQFGSRSARMEGGESDRRGDCLLVPLAN